MRTERCCPYCREPVTTDQAGIDICRYCELTVEGEVVEVCAECWGSGQVGMQLDGQPLVCAECGGRGSNTGVPEAERLNAELDALLASAQPHTPGHITAPEGYEAVTYWRDRSPSMAGSWEVAYRPLGATWWVVACSDCGHTHSADDYVRATAEERVRYHITVMSCPECGHWEERGNWKCGCAGGQGASGYGSIAI